MSNKKIRNATISEYAGIAFKSILECNCYKLLEASGLPFTYEAHTYQLLANTKRTNTIVYTPDNKNKVRGATPLVGKNISIRPITYTPDFVVTLDNVVFIIEAKGFQNDVYPIKRKLFISLLESLDDGNQYIFLEPHNSFQMNQVISIIKSYGKN